MKDKTVHIDNAGRVVLPKPLRDRFRLRGGDALEIEVRGDVIQIRPAQVSGHLKRVNGILVYAPSGSIPVGVDLAAESREERIDGLIREAQERR